MSGEGTARTHLLALRACICAAFVMTHSLVPADETPVMAKAFLATYCLDCHSGDEAEHDINLDVGSIAWNTQDSVELWTKVHKVIRDGQMPPKDADQPGKNKRRQMLRWLDESLSSHDAPGGTVLRRLNKTEYENSVRAALGVPFSISRGFPADPEFHGFDNIGEGLVLSPPVMQQYFELAGDAADLIMPPAKKVRNVEATSKSLTPEDFSMSFEASQLRDGVMRLVTQAPIVIRSCTWPTRFEAQHTGTYEVTAKFSAFKPNTAQPLEVDLLVVPPTVSFTKIPTLQRAARLTFPGDGEVHERHATIDLEAGQTVAFYWSNAPIGEDVQLDLHRRLKANPRLYAAWLKSGYDRQRSPKRTWALLKETMADEDLDVDDEKLKDPPTKFPATFVNQLGWALENMHMEQGPALNIHGATFFGPTALKESRADKDQRLRTLRFLGERNARGDREYAAAILQPFLTKAFRRPATDGQLSEYTAIALNHHEAGYRFEDGIHLAVRAALCSTHFLYRGQRDGTLDDYDLASRLSYFLTSSPPDAKLIQLADQSQLSKPDILAAETRRLLASKKSHAFLDAFLGQWLDLDRLPDIMPDERLIAKWLPQDLQAVTQETQMFVAEILRENHPLETFIDPDFTYMNRRNAKLYGIKLSGDEMRRVPLERGHRHAGILGQASVMMATANGVDTQPVLRGAWLLKNIFGDPPPEPPTNVPAIEPDTSGAKSIRDLLARHQADANCASCHHRIDPPGFALENFDPVGRWRDFYPVYRKKSDGKFAVNNGLPVDAVSEMIDGTKLNDVTDLKRYLVNNIDQFATCLAEKLLTYATGRRLSFGDLNQIERIVSEVRKSGNGFQDLLIALVLSKSFRTK